MANFIFPALLVLIPATFLVLTVYMPNRAKRRVLKTYPVGSRVRIKQIPFAHAGLEHLIGTTAEVTGYRFYNYIGPRIELNVPLVENYHVHMNIGFEEPHIEKIPELHLVTGVELRKNYNID